MIKYKHNHDLFYGTPSMTNFSPAKLQECQLVTPLYSHLLLNRVTPIVQKYTYDWMDE